MKHKNKVIVIIVSLITIVIVSIVILLIVKNDKIVELKKELEVKGYVYKEDNKILVDNNGELHYLDYKNNKVIYDKFESDSKYKIIEETDGLYLLNTQTKEKLEKINSYMELKNNNEITHYILYKEDYLEIFDVTTSQKVKLNDQIKKIGKMYDENQNLISYEYIIVLDENGKSGLIDYYGNQIIKMKYDTIIPIKDKKFIVKIDNKTGVINIDEKYLIEPKYDMLFEYDKKFVAIYNGKYGIISQIGKELLSHDYDEMKIHDNYVVFSNKGTSGIFTDKVILNPSIQLNNDIQTPTYQFNNKIYMVEYGQTMVISNEGSIKKIEKEFHPIKNEDNKYSNKYLYTIEKKGMNIKYEIYNQNHEKHYSFDIKLEDKYKDFNFKTNVSMLSNEKYIVNIDLINNKDINNNYQFVYEYDFDNKKELEPTKIKFDNNKECMLDKNNKLTIYDGKNIIGEYEDILYHIGGYYFVNKDGIVYKVIFN